MSLDLKFDLSDLKRINVVGTSSSGKSTFGRNLATLLDVPYVEMDALYHGPNWAEAEIDVFRERVATVTHKPQWVLDGNYHSKTHDIKWSRATMIVWLDIPFGLNMYRAVCRAVERSWTKKELWPGTGNCESFRQTFFTTDSMILWTAKSHWRLRKRYSQVQSSPPEGVRFVRVKGNREVDAFIDRAASLKA